MSSPVIVSAVRTPVGKAPKGMLSSTRPDDMAAVAMRAAIERVPGLKSGDVEDIYIGCAMPEAEQGMNVARLAAFRAGIPYTVPAMTLNRFCSSGLQSISFAADRINSGAAHCIVAGGTESMSMIPMGGHKVAPNPALIESYPETYLSMGLTAENLAHDFKIGREEQDAFALESHRRALAAMEAGRFRDEMVPIEVRKRKAGSGGARAAGTPDTLLVDRDESVRAETTVEALGALRPAFQKDGTVTAGNAPPVNDGAAAVVVMSAQRAARLNLTPMARIVGQATSGLPPKYVLMTPVEAVRRLSRKIAWPLDEVDLYELNEAFSVQAVAVVRELGLDPQKVNVNGGAVALGHPIGASGARILTTLLYALRERKLKRGIATLCLGGGNGVALAVERI